MWLQKIVGGDGVDAQTICSSQKSNNKNNKCTVQDANSVKSLYKIFPVWESKIVNFPKFQMVFNSQHSLQTADLENKKKFDSLL